MRALEGNPSRSCGVGPSDPPIHREGKLDTMGRSSRCEEKWEEGGEARNEGRGIRKVRVATA